MALTRREFLKTAAVVSVGTAILPAVFQRAAQVMAAEGPTSGPASRRVLVVVQLAGGNDGLNTVVPYADGRYYDLRGNLGIPQGSALPLNNEVGVHPSLARLKELWDEGKVAIIEGVGYPQPNLSHFVAMDIWRFADPTLRAREGWLGRCLESLPASPGDAFRALAVGSRLPPELRSTQVPVPILESVATYRIMTDPLGPDLAAMRTRTLLNLYDAFPVRAPFAVALDSNLAAATASSQALETAEKAYKPAVTYPRTPLASGLKLVAEAIDADLGVRVGHVSIGGFDTHASQIPPHAQLLTTVAEAIHAFYRDLQAHGHDQDVVIMTWSEFGRRARANGSGGTDHGTAGPMFVVGTPVRGGLYGERPSLQRLENDNLRFTTDFRSVYATVVESWFSIPSEAVLLGQRYAPLGFLQAGRASPGSIAPRTPVPDAASADPGPPARVIIE